MKDPATEAVLGAAKRVRLMRVPGAAGGQPVCPGAISGRLGQQASVCRPRRFPGSTEPPAPRGGATLKRLALVARVLEVCLRKTGGC